VPTRGMWVAHYTVGPVVARRLRPRVRGADGVPATGGVLLAANHRSFLDHYLLSAVCPRPMRFLGKAELNRGLFGRFNRHMGMVPVARGRADLAAIGTVIGLLREGEVVGVFPEGTRSPTGELFRFRSGLARMAAASGATVVPTGIVGTAPVWPPGDRPSWRRPPPGSLEVAFGPAMPPPEDTGASRRVFTREVRETVAKLSGQALADAYAPVERDAEG